MSRIISSFLLALAVLIIYTNGYSQGVAINATNAPPDPSAMLDVVSTTRGFLPPRVTSTQRAAIAAPASGLVVFDTDFNALFVMTGEGWMQVDYDDKWQKDDDNNLTYNQGNVGFGVSYPGAALEVNGQVKINGGSPGAGKVLTSDNTGMAIWQNSPMSILSVAQANGFSPLYTDLNFIVVPATIELTETANVMIHSTRGLGTLTAGVTTGLLNLYMCYKNINGGSITAMGLGIFGLRIPANTRIPFSLSYSTHPLSPGTYQVGLCGSCADPSQWNSNEYGYTTAMAYKLPSVTTGLSFNMQESTDGGLSRSQSDADQSSAATGTPVDPVAGNESSQELYNISIREKIEQLSRENESIKSQLHELTRSIESRASSSTEK